MRNKQMEINKCKILPYSKLRGLCLKMTTFSWFREFAPPIENTLFHEDGYEHCIRFGREFGMGVCQEANNGRFNSINKFSEPLLILTWILPVTLPVWSTNSDLSPKASPRSTRLTCKLSRCKMRPGWLWLPRMPLWRHKQTTLSHWSY